MQNSDETLLQGISALAPNCSIHIAMTDASRVGEARRSVAELGIAQGLNPTDLGHIGILVTEIANNLVKHARQGDLLLRPLSQEPRKGGGIEILAIDKGPGMADVTRCMQDGYSTSGSPGTGLGAISRLSSLFDIDSIPEVGTVLVSQVWSSHWRQEQAALPYDLGAICVPQVNEEVCGDTWEVLNYPNKQLRVLVADGLGHGPAAAEAANMAARIFKENQSESLSRNLELMHLALRSTRGAAAALTQVNFASELRFMGLGNIAGCILSSETSRSLVSHNGTIGHELHRVQEFTYPWSPGGLLILASDGLQTRWSLDLYPGLRRRHPALIAGVLYRDFQRGRDDVTVLVLKERT